MSDGPALLPAHLPFAPEFRSEAEARAWVKENFGAEVRFSPKMVDAERAASVASIAQELLRHKEAGVKVPSGINIVRDDELPSTSWWRSPVMGLAGTRKGQGPEVWLNDKYRGELMEGALRHEIGHTLDWPNIKGRSVADREFVAETYQNANDPRSRQVSPDDMARYGALGGPSIPRMLPPRRAPAEPTLVDKMVNLLRGAK